MGICGVFFLILLKEEIVKFLFDGRNSVGK